MKCTKCRRWMEVMTVVLAVIALSVGCRLVVFTGAAVVGVVGLAGYTVYKGGEYAVTGVGNLASSSVDAVSNVSKGMGAVVYADGEFRSECAGTMEETWWVADEVFRNAKLQDLSGNFDIRSGELQAKTRDGLDVKLKLKLIDDRHTELRLRVGVKGDLSTSEILFNQIQKELAKRTGPEAATAPKGDTP